MEFAERIPFVIVLLLSLSVHEWAHAWSAFRLGDDTAHRAGRLTLNPISHIDPIGTLLLPILGVPFGWAKPVPVNPARFRRNVNMGTGMAITAGAGPLSNVILALGATLILGLMLRMDASILREQPILAEFMLGGGVTPGFIPINIILAVFNLLPFYPLDGSRIVDGVMPYRWRPQWQHIARYSPLVLLAVLFLSPVRNAVLGPPMTLAYAVMLKVLMFVGGA